MDKQKLNGTTIRYAVRIARRLGASELSIRSMVHSALEHEGTDPVSPRVAAYRSRGSRSDHKQRDLIPLAARILAVARVLEAHLLWGHHREEALTHIKRLSGARLDPDIVDALLDIVRDDAATSFTGSSAARARPSAA